GEHGAAARRLAAQPDLLRYGPTSVLYALCDSVVDRYLEVADLLQVDLEEVESAVFAPEERGRAGPGVAERVYAAKRQVLAFRRATLPLTAPAERLTGAAVPFADGGARPFFRDVHDHLIRVNEQVDGLDRLLSAVHAASLAQTSVRQNDEMRRISAWAAMVAIPTAVAGVYGMNFDVMPELRSAWGYPAVLVLMAGACFALFRLFRRRGWM
ncbi:magnesium and cobalt transport protein CorA, partial [Streptomyces xiaopingdaonensis]|uniref:magnesium and cobalt transport protein CorA n=1 Tax=Streptomyces xiaopingdaonensis TaxID=1565415 RepID=UPI00037AB661